MMKRIILIFFLQAVLSAITYSQWYPETCDLENSIYSICMFNDSSGRIGLQEGICAYDGSGHWDQVCSGYTPGMSFSDSLNGWAFQGGGISRTTDGGLTWQTKYSNEYLTGRHSISSVDSQHCLVACRFQGQFYEEDWVGHTKDGGQSWDWDLWFEFPPEVLFLDTIHGWAMDINEIYITDDGGDNWQDYNNPYHGRSFYFIDSLNGWFGGFGNGIIANTLDGGINWNIQYQTGYSLYFEDIFFLDQNYGYAIGFTPSSYDTTRIFMTDNGGLTWEESYYYKDGGGVARQIIFTDSLTGWIVGGWNQGQLLIRTENGGLTWIDEEMANQCTLSIHPNPSSGNSYITVDLRNRSVLQLSLHDITGKYIMPIFRGVKNQGIHQFNLDCNSLIKGLYVVKFQSENTIIAQKFLIQ